MDMTEHKIRIEKIKQTLSTNLYSHKNNRLFSWRISPEPFWLDAPTVSYLKVLGQDLYKFYQASNNLFYKSTEKKAPEFVTNYLEQGKPETIVQLGRRPVHRKSLPLIIRPDLLFTETGIIACEFDSVPGGFGSLAAMNECYASFGDEVIGGKYGILEHFANSMKTLTGKEDPNIAIMVSDESKDYLLEMQWLSKALTDGGYLNTSTISPQDIKYEGDELTFLNNDNKICIADAIYRFFELFDLPNITNSEQLMLAVSSKHVNMTPPPKSFLEEKLWFALFHHPKLLTLWRELLSEETYYRLQQLIPHSWVMDPHPLPPHAVIANLVTELGSVNSWQELVSLSKAQRKYVIKPSGFSELAWGGHGVTVADNVSKEKWQACINDALATFSQTPYLLQEHHKAKIVTMPYWDEQEDQITWLNGRARICPYYFVYNSSIYLAGVLATIVPVEKPIIHGMSEAIMLPCAIK